MCNTVDIWQVGDKRRVWLPTDSEQYLTQHASRASDLCDNFAQTKEHKNYRKLATTCKNYQTMMALTISLNINIVYCQSLFKYIICFDRSCLRFVVPPDTGSLVSFCFFHTAQRHSVTTVTRIMYTYSVTATYATLHLVY